MKKLLLLGIVILLSSLVSANYFDNLNRMLERKPQPQWSYEILQQDTNFNVSDMIITDTGDTLEIDYIIEPKTLNKRKLKNLPIKIEDKIVGIPIQNVVGNIDFSKSNKGKFTIVKPNKNTFLMHIGQNSAIINVTSNINIISASSVMSDVFIYDITQDELDYTTWYDDESLSWYNHTIGNRLPDMKSLTTTATSNGCSTTRYSASDMDPVTYWDCTETNESIRTLLFDMGENYSFSSMLSEFHSSYNCDMNVSSSDDNLTWVDRFNKTQVDGYQYTDFNNFTARYLKFNFTNCENSGGRVIMYNLALYDGHYSGTFPNVSYIILTNNFIDIVDVGKNQLWKRISHDADADVLTSIWTQSIKNGMFAYDGTLYFGGGYWTSGNYRAFEKISYSNDSMAWYFDNSVYCFQNDALTCNLDRTNFSTFHHNNGYESEAEGQTDDFGNWMPEYIYENVANNITVKDKIELSNITVTGNSDRGGVRGISALVDGGTWDNAAQYDCWLSVSGDDNNVWVAFNLTNKKNISAISIRKCVNSGYDGLNPKDVLLYGSNDYTTWTLINYYELEDYNFETGIGGTNFRFSTPKEYQYFNFSFSSSYGTAGYMALGEIEFFDADKTEHRTLHVIGQESHTYWREDDVDRGSPVFNDTYFGYLDITGYYLDLSDNGRLIVANNFGLNLIDELYPGKQSYITRVIPLSDINDVHFLDNDSFIVSAGNLHRIYNFTTGTEIKNYSQSGADYNIIGGTSTIMRGNTPVTPRDIYMGSKGTITGSINKIYEPINYNYNNTNTTHTEDLDITDLFALRTTTDPSFYWVDYIIWSTFKNAYIFNITSIAKTDTINPDIIGVNWNQSTVYAADDVWCNITVFDDTDMTLNYTLKVNGVNQVSVNNTIIYNNYSFATINLANGNFSAGDVIGCSISVSDVEGNTNSTTTNITISAALPGACTLTFPANNTQQTNSPLALDWSDSSGVEFYYVYGDNSSGTTYINNATSSDSVWHDLVSGQTYYWKVIAHNTAGNTSCSNGNTFQFDMVVPGMTTDQDAYLRKIHNWTGNGTGNYSGGGTSPSAIWSYSSKNLTDYNQSSMLNLIEAINKSIVEINQTYLFKWNNTIMNLTEDWRILWEHFNCSYSPNKLCTYLNNINVTVFNVRISQTGNFRIELSDFPAITAGSDYYAKLHSFTYDGNLTNLSTLPTITIYDPLRNVIVNSAKFNFSSTGLYNYTYTTLTSSTAGIWESEVIANNSGKLVTLNDFWQIASSPADVEIVSMRDRTIKSIVADVEITNMGTLSSDFEYVYCIVNESDNKCGGDDDIDYQSGTRYITAGNVWSPQLGLNVDSTGIYWFKVKAKALGETVWAGASKRFEAIAQSPTEGGGASGTNSLMGSTCETNDECPIGYGCINQTCERINCIALEKLSEDGHSCIKIVEPIKKKQLNIIGIISFLIIAFILLKNENKNY